MQLIHLAGKISSTNHSLINLFNNYYLLLFRLYTAPKIVEVEVPRNKVLRGKKKIEKETEKEKGETIVDANSPIKLDDFQM